MKKPNVIKSGINSPYGGLFVDERNRAKPTPTPSGWPPPLKESEKVKVPFRTPKTSNPNVNRVTGILTNPFGSIWRSLRRK